MSTVCDESANAVSTVESSHTHHQVHGLVVVESGRVDRMGGWSVNDMGDVGLDNGVEWERALDSECEVN